MPDEAKAEEPSVIETIAVKVDGKQVAVPKLTPDWQGKLVPTTVLQACKHAGIEIPHYCYHPKLAVAGKIALSKEGQPIDLSKHFYYKGCMFSNVPNLAVVFGYLNASWTLRADINSDYVCRVLNTSRKRGVDVTEPILTAQAEAAIEEDDIFDFSSGYIQRGKAIMPRNAVAYPWRLNQEYVSDRKRMKDDPVDDGVLEFRRHGANARGADEQLEAAE